MKIGNIHLKTVLIAISAIIFLTSLPQVAFVTDYSDQSANVCYSFMALLVGWINLFGAGISWLANPLLILSWKFIYKNIKLSFVLSLLSTFFCCSFLLFDRIVVNEAGGESNIISYGNGYWLWVSSCVINCIGILFIMTKKTDSNSL